MLERGIHVLAFPGTRPLSQSDERIGMASNVGRHMATGPVGEPAGSSPLLVGDQDRVAQQTLGRGSDQPAQRLQLRSWPEMRGQSCPIP